MTRQEMIDEFDKSFNELVEVMSCTWASKYLTKFLFWLFNLCYSLSQFITGWLFPLMARFVYWISDPSGKIMGQKLMTHFLNANWNAIMDKSFVEKEKAKYGEDGFALLNQVSVKSPFSYQDVADKLPYIEPDWRNKTADELAVKLTKHVYRGI